MIKLLAVEDDENLRYNIKDGLEITVGGYEVILAVNGIEGLEFWKEEQPDIILADIDMPKMNGFEMVEYIRERDQEIPILFISGCRSSRDITTGYDLGANNYIKKPFSAHEIDAHIQALLKMRNDTRRRNLNNLQKIGNFTLDAPNGTLRFETSKSIPLTLREAQILQELCLNKGEVVKRAYLLEKYWDIPGGEDFFASRSLDVMISKLRGKLKDDPKVKIQVVKGIGVMLVDTTNLEV